jgi:hypothetical protein
VPVGIGLDNGIRGRPLGTEGGRKEAVILRKAKKVTGKDGTPLIPAQKMSDEEIMKEIERIRNSRKN